MIIGNTRFFFNSREESRSHIHVEAPDGTAKFRLEPLVSLATYKNFTFRVANYMLNILREPVSAWVKRSNLKEFEKKLEIMCASLSWSA